MAVSGQLHALSALSQKKETQLPRIGDWVDPGGHLGGTNKRQIFACGVCTFPVHGLLKPVTILTELCGPRQIAIKHL
jgi:hypothetical protein